MEEKPTKERKKKKPVISRAKDPNRKGRLKQGLYPVTAAVILIAAYFIMDMYLLGVSEEVETKTQALCLAGVLSVFYLFYVHQKLFRRKKQKGNDLPGFIADKYQNLYVILGFLVLTGLSAVLFFGYGTITTDWFPKLGDEYYQSQILLLVLMAPVMEELSFRYLLYDRWAKPRFGTVKAVLLTGFLFVICHPVGNINAMILYWIPTLAFYLVYDSFGLYGSIVAHMIYNFVAL